MRKRHQRKVRFEARRSHCVAEPSELSPSSSASLLPLAGTRRTLLSIYVVLLSPLSGENCKIEEEFHFLFFCDLTLTHTIVSLLRKQRIWREERRKEKEEEIKGGGRYRPREEEGEEENQCRCASGRHET